MDSDTAVARKRVNVEPNGCPCVGIVCLNGGICVAGSPPYCICPPGFKGLYCGESVVKPEAGNTSFPLFLLLITNERKVIYHLFSQLRWYDKYNIIRDNICNVVFKEM